jgi:hypothetical protein
MVHLSEDILFTNIVTYNQTARKCETSTDKMERRKDYSEGTFGLFKISFSLLDNVTINQKCHGIFEPHCLPTRRAQRKAQDSPI